MQALSQQVTVNKLVGEDLIPVTISEKTAVIFKMFYVLVQFGKHYPMEQTTRLHTTELYNALIDENSPFVVVGSNSLHVTDVLIGLGDKRSTLSDYLNGAPVKALSVMLREFFDTTEESELYVEVEWTGMEKEIFFVSIPVKGSGKAPCVRWTNQSRETVHWFHV